MKTLTDYEQLSFATEANLADGHAYQALTLSQEGIIGRLQNLWEKSEAESIPESEYLYVDKFATLIGSPALRDITEHLILPTASNSIDLVAAYLKAEGKRVHLTHPTFDNLALILRRRGVDPQPITEDQLADRKARETILANTDVLFIVNPNNPTGTNLSEQEFTEIVQSCVSHGVTLVIDTSFRLFYRTPWDSYRILEDSGVSYIVFEDTGKVFPTQDMKASLLTCSRDQWPILRQIYNEIYLCVSKFTLKVLGEFIVTAHLTGLEESVHELVTARRAHLRGVLGIAAIEPLAQASKISVEWLTTADLDLTDHEVEGALRSRGAGVLPGRGFFWHQPHAPKNTRNIRVSLMKPWGEFQRGVEIMAEFFDSARR